MSGINKAIIVGRVTTDVVTNKTAGGISYARFNLAVDRPGQKDQNGQNKVDFIPCTAWRQSADFLGQYSHKGNMLAVTGSICVEHFTDKNGNNATNTYVLVDNVQNLSPKGAGGAQQGGYQNAPQQGGYQNQPRQNSYQNNGGQQGGYNAPQQSGYQNQPRQNGYQNNGGQQGGYQNAPAPEDNFDLGGGQFDIAQDDLPF